MRICVAGAYGAFGIKHLDALANIDGVEVASVMGPTTEKIEALARERGIPHAATTLEECLAQDSVDAVILSTPTQLHAEQAIACLDAGKHVLVEIPDGRYAGRLCTSCGKTKANRACGNGRTSSPVQSVASMDTQQDHGG